MKMLNACTMELDDPAIAVSEVLEQLNLAQNALKNSAGFITCSYDFVETGIVRALCEALPFDIVGATTLANATNAKADIMMLCLSVLTADDCSFSAAHSAPLGVALDTAAEQAFETAKARLEEKPEFILAFLPMMGSIGGELILEALDTAVNGIPIFGTIACDADTALYSNSFTIHNGECLHESLSILLIGGNVSPHFVVTATSEQNLHKQQAIITSSEGSLLKEVNGMSAQAYFASIGFMKDDGMEGMSSVPFVVNYNDGSQAVARAIYSLNSDGSAVCGGRMPEGGTLSIGRMDVDDILLTAERSVKELLAWEGVSCIIAFPCLGRNMVLGVNPMAEIEKVTAVINDAVPFHLSYSGGEACPVCKGEGTVNRFHNFTFIACAL